MGMSGDKDTQFLDILENWVQGIAIRQGDKFVYVNQAFADLCGYETPEAVLSLGSSFSLLPESERERVSRYQAARDEGAEAPVCYELQAVRKDGSLWWAENRIQEILWNGEHAVITAVTDVTERKHADAVLRDSENRFRVIADATPTPTVINRLSDGKIIFANQAADRAAKERYGHGVRDTKVKTYWADPEEHHTFSMDARKPGGVRDREI